MKINMGSADRIIRLTIAVVLGILYFTKIITGTLGTILLVVSIFFLVTSLISFCPGYTILGFNTCKKK
jgi:hypothetical protein